VGDRRLRREDPRLLAGRGRYVGDIALPGLLHAAFVRSPHAHARVTGIDTTRARGAPGVVAVVTAADLGPAARPLPVAPPHPALRGRNAAPLAAGRVRFVGEAVAAVVAESRYAAEDAAERVEVAYVPLPSVQDPLDPTPGLVHDDVPDNVAGRVAFRRGDVDQAFRAAPRTLAERLVIGRGGGQPIEPRGLVAEYHAAAGLLTVWASTQVPHQLRLVLADFLGLPLDRIRVIAPDVGGGFGAKLIVYPEDVVVPWLARRLERPVRWLEDRVEHLLAATQERVQVHAVTVAFDGGGRVLALRDRFVHDSGAYTPRGLTVPLLTASMLSGPYRIAALEVEATSVYTNRVPVTPYRGAGQPQAVFVVERVLDLVARATGLDPAEVRRRNLLRPDELPYDVGVPSYRGTGSVVYDRGDFPATLARALELADWPRLRAACAAARAAGRRLGAGVACYLELTGAGPFEGASVRVDPCGRITVCTGAASQGQGLETSLAQVCADALGVDPEDVAVVAGDTLGIAEGVGTFASRVAVVAGSAAALAAAEVRTRALRLAARRLGVAAEDVEQEGTRFLVRAEPRRAVTLGELAATAPAGGPGEEPGLAAIRYFQPEDATYASGTHVALVEVDPASAAVRCLGYWIAHDSGRLINPMIVEGQIHGAVALGLGSALLEEAAYDAAGQPVAGSLMDYLLPTALDVPRLRIDHLETPSPRNPLGLRGVGESGALPVPAVIAAAVEDALSGLGVRITAMPLTSRRLAALLASAGPDDGHHAAAGAPGPVRGEPPSVDERGEAC
jgi:carbon-monoxide dehydrogenase large subunit